MSGRDERLVMPRSRRSPPAVMNPHTAGSYGSRQSGNTLPPLNTAFATSFAEPIHEPTPPRMSPGRHDVFSPSYPQGHWTGNGHLMAGHQHFTYSPYEYERFPTPPNQQLYQRHSPGLPGDSANIRRLPPLTIPPGREDIWQADTGHLSNFPPSFALHSIQDPGSMQSPNSYPPSYDPSYHLHSSSYPSLHGSLDARHIGHSLHFSPEGHPSAHRGGHSGEWLPGSNRAESHLVSPYARRDMMGHSPQEPSPVEYTAVKKKRKRADAAQLKILNEVYARTAFPTTEERLELAKKLDMSARSVQIWFQNKRQSTRQSRTTSGALPPIIHHPYPGTTQRPPSRSGPSPRPEISVTSTSHGGSYGSRSPGSSSTSQRAVHNTSPRPPPTDAYRRGRSPDEGVTRIKRPY